MRPLQSAGTLRSSPRGSCCAALLLVIVLACASCASPTASSPQAASPIGTVALRSPRQMAASAWEELALPVPAADIHGVAVSPADPAIVFACSAHLQTPKPPGSMLAQPMTFWRTTDAGSHWTRYAPALGAGTQCLFSIAPDDPQRVTLQVTQTAQDEQPCAHDTFYLSANGGATWQRLLPHASIAPTGVSSGWCDLHVTQHHLFLAYSFTPSASTFQVSLLERSDDNGATWTQADRGLGTGALFFMPDIGPNEALAATVINRQAHPGSASTELWTSADAGQTWRRTSTLPEGAGTFLLTSIPPQGSAWPTPADPFYALEQEQIPSNLYQERILESKDGQSWTLLPPLPVPGVSEQHRGILQTLNVLPDGRLAVWGTDPHVGVPAPNAIHGPMSAFWVWLWDPAAQRWRVLPSPLNVPAAEGCGLCWAAQSAVSRDGAIYLYVSRFDSGTSGTTLPGMFRMRLPKGT